MDEEIRIVPLTGAEGGAPCQSRGSECEDVERMHVCVRGMGTEWVCVWVNAFGFLYLFI